jgi:glycosyltransferase involved in cell wall biosynthesis
VNDLLSVVIPALNSAHTLGKTLLSVFSNEFPRDKFEVIVVDNGSTDKTVDVAKRFPVRLHFCAKRGQGPALNYGIRQAIGDIVCIIASDVVVPDDWLRKISDFFDNNPMAEGVGGLVLSPADCVNDIQRFNGELFTEDQGFPKKVAKSEYLKVGGSLYATNCAYRKKTLIEAGGFDEALSGSSFFDIDLSWKLVRKGKLLLFDPNLKAVHIGFPSTLQEVIKQQFKWGKGKAELMKNYALPNVGIKDYVKRTFWPVAQIVRAYLQLFLPTRYPKKKALVRAIHYTTYHFGRIYGRG